MCYRYGLEGAQLGLWGDASHVIGSYKPSKGLYSCLCAKHRRELVIWGSFVGYVPVFLMCLAFEYYVFACLDFGAAWASDELLYVMLW